MTWIPAPKSHSSVCLRKQITKNKWQTDLLKFRYTSIGFFVDKSSATSKTCVVWIGRIITLFDVTDVLGSHNSDQHMKGYHRCYLIPFKFTQVNRVAHLILIFLYLKNYLKSTSSLVWRILRVDIKAAEVSSHLINIAPSLKASREKPSFFFFFDAIGKYRRILFSSSYKPCAVQLLATEEF